MHVVGILWIAMLGYRNIHSEYDLLIVECKSMLSIHSNYVVTFTRRQANGSAHVLARAALSHASRITFDYIPICIATLIMNEIP
jgi:type IV secretory pathway ATPase VirB11/archaellum biosynthesis ATPase